MNNTAKRGSETQMAHEHMPAERNSVTKKIQLGDLKGYATVGLYPDGRPGELFLTFKKQGSLERGLTHTLALMVSVALQNGTPIEKVVEKLKGVSFEPNGLSGDPACPLVNSISDYLGRWLESKFCNI